MGKVDLKFGTNANLYIGALELQRMQFILEQSRSLTDEGLVKSYGLCIRKTSSAPTYSTEWLLYFQGGLLLLAPGTAFIKDADGIVRAVISRNTKTLTVPSDGIWNVLLEPSSSTEEVGTIALTNASKNVVGTGTEFTNILRANGSIIVDGIPYPVETITDDTHATLIDPYPGINKAAAKYSAGGWFINPPIDRTIYKYDSFNIIITTDDASPTQIKLADLTVIEGVPTNISDLRSLSIFRLWSSDERYEGTPWNTFYVGLGTDHQREVLTKQTTPPVPLNLRVVDVVPETSMPSIDAGAVSGIAAYIQNARSTNRATVLLRWNHDNIQGTGGANTFTITNSNGENVFTLNQLVGYKLYVPTNGKHYTISANAATSGGQCVLTINEDGVNVNLTGVTVSSGGVIHSGADRYCVIATPQLSGNPVAAERVVANLTFEASQPSPQQYRMILNVGYNYDIKIMAISYFSPSALVALGTGTYTKPNPPYTNWSGTPAGGLASFSFTNPYLVKLPKLVAPATNAIRVENNNLLIDASAWPPASEFELVYKMSVEPNFGDADAISIIATGRVIPLMVRNILPGVWRGKIRPLMAGQAVGDAISFTFGDSIISTDSPPQSYGPVFGQVRAYTAQIAASGSSFDLTNLKDEAGGAFSILPPGLIGRGAISDSALTEYLISEQRNSLKIDVQNRFQVEAVMNPPSASNVTSGNIMKYHIYRATSGTVTYHSVTIPVGSHFVGTANSDTFSGGGTIVEVAGINAFRRGRRIGRMNFFIQDVALFGAFVDPTIIFGNPVLCFYQDGFVNDARSVVITAADNGFYTEFTSPLILDGKKGPRNLVIEAWDLSADQSAPQFTGFIGQVWPYGKVL